VLGTGGEVEGVGRVRGVVDIIDTGEGRAAAARDIGS
jgi:hypothetical protein